MSHAVTRTAPPPPNRDVEAEIERMLEMGREIRGHMREPVSSDLSDLYDESGFPIAEGTSRVAREPVLKS
jgi:hypothetical protein